jgi:hypothetical protein
MAVMSATDDYLQMARCGSHEAAFHGLLDLGQQVIPSLVQAYRSESDPQVRALIVEVVWQHRCPSALDFLVAALGDPHPAVWKQALDGLVAHCSPEAEQRLRAAACRLEEDDERLGWFQEAIEQITEAIAGQRS